MRPIWLASIAAGAVTASPALAPAPAWIDPRVVRPLNELEVRDPMEAIRAEHLEKRVSADFSLDHEWNNEVLFSGTWTESDDSLSESVSLSVTCVECWTKGTVTAKLTTEDIIKPVIRLEFEGVEAYVDLDVSTSASATYAINLFATESPLGLSLPGLDIGLVFYVDLVFSLSATIDLEGGFYVKLEDDAYLETDVFTGDITDHFFDGIGTKSIPVTVHSGSATFKADLRLRVQCGAEADFDLIGIGAGAVVGIYANIIEFVAVLDSTPTCELQTREWFDLNVGAYARVSVAVDYETIGLVPTVSTTFFSSPTFTQCWIDDSPVESGTGSAGLTTTVSTIAASTRASTGRTVSPPTTTTSASPSTVLASTVSATSASASFTSQRRPPYTPSAGFSLPLLNSSVTTVDTAPLVTSTVYSTTEYTITSCAASVVNCPASWEKQIVVTKTIDSYTTVCPAGASITIPATTATPSSVPEVAAVHVITKLVVLSKIEPVTETFVEPTGGKPTHHHVTAVIAAPTTVVLPVVNYDDVSKTTGYQNSTAAAGPTTIGTGSMTKPTAAPTVPVNAAGQQRFDGLVLLVACAVYAVVAGLA